MRRRTGYTLIELLMATASATALMVGLSGALYVSAQALDSDDGAVARRTNADNELSRLVADVREARSFQTLASNEIRFTVPDRDGDGLDDVVQYSWSGSPGDALQRRLNDGELYDFLPDVRTLDFVKLARSVPALDVTVSPPPPWPVLESNSSVIEDSATTSLTLSAPTGVAEGELLMAAVVIHNVSTASVTPPAGWMQLDLNEDANHVTFGLWWKLAGASEPADYEWVWSGSDEAIGVALRVSNQYDGNPLTATVMADGKSQDPRCPSTSSVLDHSMVLRIGGFHKDKIDTIGQTGLVDHVDVFMDQNAEVGLGVGYAIQDAAGITGPADFVLGASKEWRTVTVVVAPKQ